MNICTAGCSHFRRVRKYENFLIDALFTSTIVARSHLIRIYFLPIFSFLYGCSILLSFLSENVH
jgi:hypothetical protein